jgi:ABC-type multidrug transport system fused ATPase/permease subunit
MELINLINRLWRHIEPARRKQLAILTVLMVFTSLAEVVSIGAILPFLGVLMAPEIFFERSEVRPVIGLLGLTRADQLIFPLTASFIAAVLFSGLMKIFLFWYQTRIAFGIGADFSKQIYEKTLYQPYSVHVSRNSSQLISGISSKSNTVIYSVLLPLLVIASSLLILIVILAALVAVNPLAALLTFGGFGSLYGLILLFTRSRLAKDGARVNYESTQVIKALQEGLGGIRDVLIDGTQATYCRIYSRADLPLRRAQANIQIISASPRFLIESLGMVLIALIAYELSKKEAGLSDAIPMLGALAIGAQRLLPVLQQLYLNWSYIRGGQASQKDVLELLEQPMPEYLEKSESVPLAFNSSISLNQVSFSYSANDPPVLKGIDLMIMKGSRSGFVGPTGSGKSTLIDLLMGLLQPSEGTIKIDNVQVSKENQHSWRARIAHVPQLIFLADDTITANIAFGISSDKIDMHRVREAARQAQISTVIETWENQYDTFVGERGIRLSGGQRQRIGIARALYKRADVIVFDEATSALDNETEEAVMNAIDTIGRDITILIVAHRISTLRNCDQIFEVSSRGVKSVGKQNIN